MDHGKKNTPVGVIHGRTQKQRLEMLEYYYKEGYRYVALGSMVPLAETGKALKIAGITNLKKPKIGKKASSPYARTENEIAYFGTEQP